MPQKTVREIYEDIKIQADRTRKEVFEDTEEKVNVPGPVKLEEAAQLLISTAQKRKVLYNKELHEAMQMAEDFDKNRVGKDGYVIREGMDVHDMIDTIVILWRTLRTEISQGNIEIVSKAQMGG